MKNSYDIIGNRTRDLLACGAPWSRRLPENISQLINNSTPFMHLALSYTACTKIMHRNILLSTCLCSQMVSDREHVCRVLNRVQCSLTDRESWCELWNKTQMKRSIIRSICPEVAECLTNFSWTTLRKNVFTKYLLQFGPEISPTPPHLLSKGIKITIL